MKDKAKGGTMQYRVQTAVETTERTFELRSGWVDAENHLHAAVVFMLEQPVDGREYLDPITVVEEDTYRLGNYMHKAINVACDFEVGLRQ